MSDRKHRANVCRVHAAEVANIRNANIRRGIFARHPLHDWFGYGWCIDKRRDSLLFEVVKHERMPKGDER